MMPENDAHVLADTNVIIEAHRNNCWKALVGHYKMDTVEKCIEECATGNQRLRNPVPIDTVGLEQTLVPKKVSQYQINVLYTQCKEACYLDAGEKHLLAHCLTLDDVYLVCSPDKMCMQAGYALGIVDKFVSLEELIEGTGKRAQVSVPFTRRWTEQFRTRLKLGLK